MLYRFSNNSIFIIVILLFICRIDVYGYSPTDVDKETLALHSLQTIFHQNKEKEDILTLRPENNSTPSPPTVSMQDATMILMDIQRNWDQWSPMFKAIAKEHFLTKPADMSPLLHRERTDGEGAAEYMPRIATLGSKSVRVAHLFPNWVETQNFSIEWGGETNSYFNDDNGTNSGKILSCSNGSSPCSGIPDVIDNWADYFEEVWETQVLEFGYIEPAGTEAHLYDIYISNTGDGIPVLSQNYLGYTVTYCDADYFNICKENVKESYSYIVVNGYRLDKKTMKITAAHEFFHAIQFSYPTIDNWFSRENRWWIEASSTWMEEMVYDDINHYYSRAWNWLQNPNLSLKYSGSDYSDHEYGGAIFIIFMTDVYLKDPDSVRYIWENEDSGIGAIDKVLSDLYASDFESAFKEFVALNAVADIGSEKGGYEEGSAYGRASLTMSHSDYPVPYFAVSGEEAPQELGSNYIKFTPPDNNDNRLTIVFDGADNVKWSALVVKVKSDGTGFAREEMELDQSEKIGCHSINGFGTDYSEVFLVPAVLVDPELRETASYYYKASMDGSCDSRVTNVYLSEVDSQADNSDIQTINKDRCFIATAAFGSIDSPYVMILRDFRDTYLMPNSVGKSFVSLYYRVSPALADFIEQHPTASFFVRMALYPVAGLALIMMKTSITVKIILILIILSIIGMRLYKAVDKY